MWLKVTGKSIYFTIICHLKRIFVFNYGKNRSKCWRYFSERILELRFEIGMHSTLLLIILPRNNANSPQGPLHRSKLDSIPPPSPIFRALFPEGPISCLQSNLQHPCETCWPQISSQHIHSRDPTQQQRQQASRNVSAPPHPVVGNRSFSVMILILWILGIFHQPSRKTIVRAMESRTPT